MSFLYHGIRVSRNLLEATMAREGKRYSFRRLLFWADSGMICVEDTLSGEFDVVMVREFLLRAKAINDSLSRFRHADERNEHQNFVENAIQACKQAVAQGRPDDPKAVADLLKARRRQVFYMGGTLSEASNCVSADSAPEGNVLPVILGPDGEPFFRPEKKKQRILM